MPFHLFLYRLAYGLHDVSFVCQSVSGTGVIENKPFRSFVTYHPVQPEQYIHARGFVLTHAKYVHFGVQQAANQSL